MNPSQNATSNPATSHHKYNHAYGSSAASGSYYPPPNRVIPPAINPLRNSAVLNSKPIFISHRRFIDHLDKVPAWKPSPFYRIDQPVSILQECPGMSPQRRLHLLTLALESQSSSDRRVARFNFYLQPEQLAKLQQPRLVNHHVLHIFTKHSIKPIEAQNINFDFIVRHRSIISPWELPFDIRLVPLNFHQPARFVSIIICSRPTFGVSRRKRERLLQQISLL
jgi:hypothetical protein